MSTIPLSGALAFVITGGITTFFAPCAFPLLGGYVGHLFQNDRYDHALIPAIIAAGGTLSVLITIGASGMIIGHELLSELKWFEPIVGVGLIVVGVLQLTDRGPALRIQLPPRTESLSGFALFGVGYGAAAAGCVLPILVGVIGQALAFDRATGLLLITAYAGAVAIPLLGVTMLVGTGIDIWKQAGRYTGRLQELAAILMILAGIGQLAVSLWVFNVF